MRSKVAKRDKAWHLINWRDVRLARFLISMTTGVNYWWPDFDVEVSFWQLPLPIVLTHPAPALKTKNTFRTQFILSWRLGDRFLEESRPGVDHIPPQIIVARISATHLIRINFCHVNIFCIHLCRADLHHVFLSYLRTLQMIFAPNICFRHLSHT